MSLRPAIVAPCGWLNVLTCGHLAAGARKCIECLGVIGVADCLNDTAGFHRWRARTEKAKRKGQNKAGNREARAFEAADAEWERSQA